MTDTDIIRVAGPAGFHPDPTFETKPYTELREKPDSNPTFEKKPDPDSALFLPYRILCSFGIIELKLYNHFI